MSLCRATLGADAERRPSPSRIVPQLDVICVPQRHSAPTRVPTVNDRGDTQFLREQAKAAAKYVTSVCTGSLVLGAAGLLEGYNAATHWSAMQYLSAFGANPTKTRVCVDRNRITGGGVTAGIDFALTLVSILDRPENRGGDPARARIQSGAAVQRRLARHRAAGNSGTCERANCGEGRAPRRCDRAGRNAIKSAGVGRLLRHSGARVFARTRNP